MILLPLLLQAGAAPTVATVDRLSPAEAGAMVLRGKAHLPIEAVAMVEPGYIAPPGFVERDLIEQPVRNASGCVRRRWRTSFRSPTLEREGTFVLDSIYAMTEVALTATSTCPRTDYVHLNPGIDQAAGLAMLTQVERIRMGRIRVAFDCKDDTGDLKFCRSRMSILRELATRKAWIMAREGGGLAVWLRGPTPGIVTLRLGSRTPDRIAVTKAYPAPF